MTSEIPPEFDKPWSMSDVIIHSNNSDGKEIHAYKGILATYSPYFRVLFFGDFKEKNDASVNVDCDYDAVLEIMKNVHHIGFKYTVAQNPYSSEMLVKMYRAADLYDFPLIRRMCLEQMQFFANIDMATASGDLELYDLRKEILAKMTPDDVNKYLRNCCYSLDKQEFQTLFEKAVGKSLPKPKKALNEMPKLALNLAEIAEDLKNPRVDLTKPWKKADLMIITENNKERILYGNKTVIEMMCNFGTISATNELGSKYCYICRGQEHQLEGPEMLLARIDEEYTVVKEILTIIHMCNMDYEKERVLHPVLLHAMYRAADRSHLDISLVRRFCVGKLLQQKTVDALEVLFRIEHFDDVFKLVRSLSVSDLHEWFFREDGHLSYWKGSEVFVVTTSQTERVFNKTMSLSLLRKFKVFFFPPK